MRREKLKTPEDYEIFSFRTTKEDKEALNAAIEEVVELYNRRLDEGHRKIRKNDVIMEALEKGLALMKRSKGR